MVHGSMEIVHEGWLIKSPPPKRLWRAKWRRRWFVLRHSGELPGQYFLEYYTDETRRRQKGKIELDQCEQVDAGITFANRKFEYKHMFDIKTPRRMYYLCAETEHEMNKWVDCVCQVCGLKVYTHEEEYFYMPAADSLGPLPSTPAPDQLSTDQVLPYTPHHDSPPLSPSSLASNISGPYIPISECITGRRTNFPFTDDMPLSGSLDNHRTSIPNEMVPPASVVTPPPVPHSQISSPSGPAENTGAKPRESFDAPRLLRPSGSEEGTSVLSPLGTEASSFMSDDDLPNTPHKVDSSNCFVEKSATASGGGPQVNWNTYPPSGVWEGQGAVGGAAATIGGLGTDMKCLNVREEKGKIQAPPRPPKPPHLAEPSQQNYQNLDVISKLPISRKNSSEKNKNLNCSSLYSNVDNGVCMSDPEPSPASVNSSVLPPTPREGANDDMYDIPHQPCHDSASSPIDHHKQQCCNSFTPSVVPGAIFSYDFGARESGDRVAKDENTSAVSPSGSFSRGSNKSPISPPAVDRGLKPKKPVEGGSVSGSELSPPPSGDQEVVSVVSVSAPPTSAPPLVDRNLKPQKKPNDLAPPTSNFVLEPAPLRFRPMDQRKTPAAPSPTLSDMRNGRGGASGDEGDATSNPGSRRNSAVSEEQIYYPFQSVRSRSHEVQYLDLDLDAETHSPTQVPAKVNANESVVYRKVDFVRTEAFNKTRQNVEDIYRKNQ